jgi:hypothetical protein
MEEEKKCEVDHFKKIHFKWFGFKIQIKNNAI